jgi:hypothetical protein
LESGPMSFDGWLWIGRRSVWLVGLDPVSIGAADRFVSSA